MVSPTRLVRLHTVLACCVPLIGSNSDSRVATFERCQCCIAGREVGQFRSNGIPAKVQNGSALHLTAAALARAEEQPPDTQWYFAKQRAKPHPVMAFAGQCAAAGHTRATTLAQDH